MTSRSTKNIGEELFQQLRMRISDKLQNHAAVLLLLFGTTDHASSLSMLNNLQEMKMNIASYVGVLTVEQQRVLRHALANVTA